ncbi:hypothetical protein F2Q69_00005965 [Brassica cretica]|uniref:Uncharacterized protein n=1 Tax=Brassica cretica TaxID=69181 RepID=A0A8S9PDY5_BRACR|nr:hypothetical protein F2Q69_00005965 [Brassica cretica]
MTIELDHRSILEMNNRSIPTSVYRSTAKRAESPFGHSRLEAQVFTILQDYPEEFYPNYISFAAMLEAESAFLVLLFSQQRYMPSSTRSNKETQLLFLPDPASLERSFRKEARSSSTDNNPCVSLDSAQPPSTQTLVPSTDTRSPLSTDNTHIPTTNIFHPTSIDTPSQISIDTELREMVAPLILVRDNNEDLHDQEGHLRNAAGQRTDAQAADDFWQVVKEEKLQEGDFEVESLMSFGGSHWCRSTPDLEHRSTYTNPNRSTGTPEHRSTTPKESTRLAMPAKPKPSEYPPETVRTPSDDREDPMEEDRVPTGRTLRRRKEKVEKQLKRGANEKEKENFRKRVFRIPLRIIAACHGGAEYETEYSASIETHTATSVDSSHHKLTDIPHDESVDSRPNDWENDYYNPAIAAYTRQHMHTEEYDEDYEEEQATEYRAILDEEDKLLHHSSGKRNAPSIDMTSWPSIDTQPHQRYRKRASTDTAYYKSIDTEVNRPQEGHYSIGSWADEYHHESFAVETSTYAPGENKLQDSFTDEELLNMQRRDGTDQI